MRISSKPSFAVILALAISTAAAEAVSQRRLCDWEFSRDGTNWTSVTVPHDWAIAGPFDMTIDAQDVAVTEDGEKSARRRVGRTGALPWIGKGFYRRMVELPDGGHGGMDFLMDLRWAYWLQNGLPLDIDVYDLASWSAVYALSEISAKNRGAPVDIPDFTRGAWKTAKPFDIGVVDLKKMGFKASDAKADKAAMNV